MKVSGTGRQRQLFIAESASLIIMEAALCEACLLGDLESIKYLIDECGVDPKSCQDEDGDTPLHYAARKGELSVLRYLIKEKQCDPMCGGKDGWTVLHVAAFLGDLQVVQYLIDECGVDLMSCQDEDGDTPLYYAAQNGQLSVLRYLIKRSSVIQCVEIRVVGQFYTWLPFMVNFKLCSI